MPFTELMTELDATVQELRMETGRHAFTDKLARIVSLLAQVPDSTAGEAIADDVTRIGELVDEAAEAIERRIDARLDNQEVQQRLAGTIYELRRREESINLWFRHSSSRPS
jgi:predicted Zn-dependent protease